MLLSVTNTILLAVLVFTILGIICIVALAIYKITRWK